MPSGSAPLPRDLVESVGDFKAALKDIRDEVRAIDRESKKLLDKGVVSPDLAARRGELMLRESSIQERQRFDKWADSWARRKAAAAGRGRVEMDRGDVGDLRDVWDLARGDFTTRNMVGAGSLVGKLRKSGLQGAKDLVGMIPGAIGRSLGIGADMAAYLAPIAWLDAGRRDLQAIFDQANKEGDFYRAQDKALGKFVADPAHRSAMTEAFRIAARETFTREESFDERMEKYKQASEHYTKLMGEALSDPQGTALVLKRNFGMDIPGDKKSVEAALNGLVAEGLLDEALTLADARRHGRAALQSMQAEYFATNPQASAKFHDQARQAARLERYTAERSARAW